MLFVFTGVVLADMAPLISSNLRVMELAANLMLLKLPCMISLDFLPVKLGLKDNRERERRMQILIGKFCYVFLKAKYDDVDI